MTASWFWTAQPIRGLNVLLGAQLKIEIKLRLQYFYSYQKPATKLGFQIHLIPICSRNQLYRAIKISVHSKAF